MSTGNAGVPRDDEFLSDRDIYTGYKEGEVSGPEVIGRVILKLELPADVAETPLLDKNGNPFTDDDGRVLTREDGSPLLKGDYLTPVDSEGRSLAERHGAADAVLNFVLMPPTDSRFKLFQGAIRRYFPSDGPAGNSG